MGAYLVADISHISELCLSGDHHHSQAVGRPPRRYDLLPGRLAAKIDKAVFPGVQGGPHNHITAAIAVALGEASQPEFNQ